MYFVIDVYATIYYVIILAWAILYMGLSLMDPIPWLHCVKEWATDREYKHRFQTNNQLK